MAKHGNSSSEPAEEEASPSGRKRKRVPSSSRLKREDSQTAVETPEELTRLSHDAAEQRRSVETAGCEDVEFRDGGLTEATLNDDDHSLAALSDLPSDTMVAVRLMLSQFPKFIDKVAVRPFVLRSQVYSSVDDHTEVDRDLEVLRRRKEIRMFKLNTGQDDYAVMLMADYMTQVSSAEERMKSKRPESEAVVFQWFRAHVLSSNSEVAISHNELVTSLSQGGKLQDKHITLLINAGLLVRQLSDDTSYWFSIPNVGLVLKNLTEGRKELLSFIAKRRYKEILQHELEKRRLRYSKLDMLFHLRDLLGSGKLETVDTTVGPLIRLARD